MSKLSLKQLRIDTAIQMCIQNPHLIKMLLSRNPDEPRDSLEKVRFEVLKELAKTEPSIMHILRFYDTRQLI